MSPRQSSKPSSTRAAGAADARRAAPLRRLGRRLHAGAARRGAAHGDERARRARAGAHARRLCAQRARPRRARRIARVADGAAPPRARGAGGRTAGAGRRSGAPCRVRRRRGARPRLARPARAARSAEPRRCRRSPTGGSRDRLSPRRSKRRPTTLVAQGRRRRLRRHLLDGVTGSGKTEVYFEAIAAALARGRQVLVLLPEIALDARSGWRASTTASARRRRTGIPISARPSAARPGAASPRAGSRSWSARARRCSCRSPISASSSSTRSTTRSFKQEDGVIYHARDMAVVRASLAAPIVLASATPSLESDRSMSSSGRYRRAASAGAPRRRRSCPTIRVDRPAPRPAGAAAACCRRRSSTAMTRDAGRRRAGAAVPQSPRLCAADAVPRLRPPHPMPATARPGWSSIASAAACTAIIAATPSRCRRSVPDCGDAASFAACGPGVERLAEEVAARFPEARVARHGQRHADRPARRGGAGRARRGARDRHPDRHADGGEGPSLSRC